MVELVKLRNKKHSLSVFYFSRKGKKRVFFDTDKTPVHPDRWNHTRITALCLFNLTILHLYWYGKGQSNDIS